MKKKEFVTALANCNLPVTKNGEKIEKKITNDQADAIYDAIFGPEGIIMSGLKDDGEVVLKDFASFKVGRVEARMGKNLQTGEDMEVPAYNTVRFRASKRMKELIQE